MLEPGTTGRTILPPWVTRRKPLPATIGIDFRLAECSTLERQSISLAALGRREEALACYDQALTVDPQQAGFWNNKGVTLADLGRREEALSCYNQALTLDPKCTYAWNNQGRCLIASGCLEEAIMCYDQALRLDPQYSDAWYNKALGEEQAGRFREAARSFERFIALPRPRPPRRSNMPASVSASWENAASPRSIGLLTVVEHATFAL